MPGPQPTIAILGSGAVGALIGAELTRAGVATTLVTRDASAEAIGEHGITVTSPRFGDHANDVDVRTTLDEPVDVLLVAVKAPQLATALKRVTATPGTVVPLLNGVDHVATLRERFGAERVVAGTVRVQAHREGRTKVVHRAPFLTITLAQPGAPALEQALTNANIDTATGASEADVLWAKLSRLAALALSTTAADAPLGDVRETAEAVAREVAAVATAEGAKVDADTDRRRAPGLARHRLLLAARRRHPRHARPRARRHRRRRPARRALSRPARSAHRRARRARAAAHHRWVACHRACPTPRRSPRTSSASRRRSRSTPTIARTRRTPRTGSGWRTSTWSASASTRARRSCPGITIHADSGVTGNFRVLCDGEHEERARGRGGEMVEAVAAERQITISPGGGRRALHLLN